MIALGSGNLVGRAVHGNLRANGGNSLAASTPPMDNSNMGAAMLERTRKYLDTGEVAKLLERSQWWVRDRFEQGVFRGHRDGHRKITVQSVREYMLSHGIDQSELDEYLESHP